MQICRGAIHFALMGTGSPGGRNELRPYRSPGRILVANWVFCLRRWPPHPRDAINRVPTPVAIASLGFHRQFASSIRKDTAGEFREEKLIKTRESAEGKNLVKLRQ
jgi:hypothetical protein